MRWKRIESAYLASIHLHLVVFFSFELQIGTELNYIIICDAFTCLVRGDF